MFYKCYGFTFIEGSAFDTYFCDNDGIVEDIECDALEAIFTQQAECECELYNILYDLVSESTQKRLKAFIDGDLKDFSEWNDVLGCDINLVCDLSSGEVINNNSESIGKISTTSGDTAFTTNLADSISSANIVLPDLIVFILLLFVNLFYC